MMRRALLVLASAAVLMVGNTAQAVITGTAHVTGVGAAGPCSACHIPHGGGAERLWPVPPSSGTNIVGTVSGLCASCHLSSGAYLTAMTSAHSDDYVYGALSHGVLMANGTSVPWGTDAAASGLPYSANDPIECTTCHNVHDDTIRPFLRADMNVLCAMCHTNRHFVDGVDSTGSVAAAGKWDANGDGSSSGIGNPGSHPVGSDITGDVYGGNSVISIPTIMSVQANTILGGWSLGGKRWDGTDTGGVTCVTCHTVHGVQYDSQDTVNNDFSTSNDPVNANYLAVEQSLATFSNSLGRSIANGDGDGNFLCEACHGGGNNPSVDPQGNAWSDTTFNVNPGGTGTFSHPIDTYPSSISAGVTAFGANWPTGANITAGTNVDPVPICESCHGPHPAADASREDYANAQEGQYILRNDANLICDDCHTATPTDHHPVGVTYDSSGVSYLPDVTGNANDTLTCSSCHSGAHNWPAASWVGLDAGWLPADNGRSTIPATDQYNVNMSRTCMDCHYGMDGDDTSLSPTFNDGITGETEYQTASGDANGTHYIGGVHLDGTWVGTTQGPRVTDIFSANPWSDDLASAGAGWSRWGNTPTKPVMVCESCHELEPDKNVSGDNLLLAAFTEGSNGDEGNVAGRDDLCEACHGVPDGTHPLTGMTVSRTGQPLDAGASWLRSPVGNATMDTTNDYVSCDSCHQVHDANPNSVTFILDAPDTYDFGSGPVTLVGAGSDDTTDPELDNVNAELQPYVVPTLSGRGGDFTGFCDQCHIYAY